MPEKIQHLSAILRLAHYVRTYIKNHASISAKLCELHKEETKRSVKQSKWSDITKMYFKRLKQVIMNITYLTQPDMSKEFHLKMNALSTDIGRYFYRSTITERKMIHAFFKKLDKSQIIYSVIDRKPLAVVK